MVKSCWPESNMKIYILLMKGVILLCRNILETRRISHLHGSALFKIRLIEFLNLNL